MSRIGKLPVPIPDGVKVSVAGNVIHAEGSKGKLSQTLPQGIAAKVEDQELRQDGEAKTVSVVALSRAGDSRQQKALHGLARSLTANMMKGVMDGFEKRLLIEGVGYSAKLAGKTVELQVGFSHPVTFDIPNGLEVEVPSATEIVLRGVDRQLVGEAAAEIRAVRPPEPYKGKGIRYSDETVKRKAGKAFVATE